MWFPLSRRVVGISITLLSDRGAIEVKRHAEELFKVDPDGFLKIKKM
jgi:hypothetical protein